MTLKPSLQQQFPIATVNQQFWQSQEICGSLAWGICWPWRQLRGQAQGGGSLSDLCNPDRGPAIIRVIMADTGSGVCCSSGCSAEAAPAFTTNDQQPLCFLTAESPRAPRNRKWQQNTRSWKGNWKVAGSGITWLHKCYSEKQQLRFTAAGWIRLQLPEKQL